MQPKGKKELPWPKGWVTTLPPEAKQIGTDLHKKDLAYRMGHSARVAAKEAEYRALRQQQTLRYRLAQACRQVVDRCAAKWQRG